MSFLALAASTLILGQSASVRGVEMSEPIVQVGLFAYEADGNATARAVYTPPGLGHREAVVWATATLCQLGAGRMPAEGTAAHAWRFTGKIVSSTPEEAVVQLEWRRTLDHGQAVAGPGSSVQLTLRVGEPVPLDLIAPTSSKCAASSAFEARYESRHIPMRHGTGGSGGVGYGAATGGGTGHAFKQYGTQRGSSDVGGSSAAAPGASVAPAAPASGAFEMSVWLVHTAPGREERVHYLAQPLSRSEGANFTFPRLALAIPEGEVSVQIGGSFSIENDGRDLVFTPVRTVMFKSAAGRTSGTQRRGEGKVSSPMPGPNDVLSFELPPVWTGTGPGIPDKFAIRVRLAPLSASGRR